MNFLISDTFSDAIVRLNNEEQSAVKNTVFDLQVNPQNPGHSFHKLDRAKDKAFWSVRVNRDVRLIVHRSKSSLLLCYVAHHDDAYYWAERRKLVSHPKTGAAQIVEIVERVEEITVPVYVTEERVSPNESKPRIFSGFDDDYLLSLGIPEEWLSRIRQSDEDSILDIVEHLPGEASDAVLEIAVGGNPIPRPIVSEVVLAEQQELEIAFTHPDAQRRFRVLENKDELEQALDYPWEKWTVFLHPSQREVVEKDFSGPARVVGSAGTGKTVVALHRAVRLAEKNEHVRVLVSTFSDSLAHSLQNKLKVLLAGKPRLGERIDVLSMNKVRENLYRSIGGKLSLVEEGMPIAVVESYASSASDFKFSSAFVVDEWLQVVDAWAISNLQDYLVTARLGRRTRLAQKQREVLWPVFEELKNSLEEEGLITRSGQSYAVANELRNRANMPYDHIVIDEAQDLSMSQLALLSAMAGTDGNALFFAGDSGQRIFRLPFSWLKMGIDIRGRSASLKVNYRTSHQIRRHADMLLDAEIFDADGNSEDRRGTVSIFNSANPQFKELETEKDECDFVANWLSEQIAGELDPREIGVFVRSENESLRAVKALEAAGINFVLLDEKVEVRKGHASVSTMHFAKGLEFKSVIIMACEDGVIPSEDRINEATDVGDLDEIYNSERRLLYVAATRARESLLITGVGMLSEFVEDMIEGT